MGPLGCQSWDHLEGPPPPVGLTFDSVAMANPTVVLITDRNDLDDQLFGEVFAPARLLPERPKRAG